MWFWDFNNDGALDLYVAELPTAWSMPSARGGELLRRGDSVGASGALPGRRARPLSRRRRGSGAQQVPIAARWARTSATSTTTAGSTSIWGPATRDYESLMPNVLYRNVGGKKFVDVTCGGRWAHLQKGHAIAFADLERDGDLDVFAQMGGAFPGDDFADALVPNPGFGNHWLALELDGRRSNRSAIGARDTRRRDENGGEPLHLPNWVNSGGSFGASPLEHTVRLGKADIDRDPRGVLAHVRCPPRHSRRCSLNHSPPAAGGLGPVRASLVPRLVDEGFPLAVEAGAGADLLG